MKQSIPTKITSRLLLLAILLPAVVSAQAEPNKQADAALAKLAAGTRKALIGLNVEHAPNRNQPFLGAFISDDGLALVNLGSLARKQKPTVWIDKGDKMAKLKLGSILAILPELELALVKFDHRPKVWLKIAEKEPKVDETVALVPVPMEGVWRDEIPPVIGPIMVKRRGTSSNLRETCFNRILSLGVWLTPNLAA
jgi:hypothetical protein